MDKLSTVLRILDNENRLLERADQKAISMLSIIGVFMVFFIVYSRVIPINYFTIIFIVTYFLCALIAIVNLIMAMRPRIRKDEQEADTINEISDGEPAFFTGICQFPNISAYKECLNAMMKDDESIMNIYIKQIFSVARINAAKYKYVQRGILLGIVALAVELVTIVYLFIYRYGLGHYPPIE
jgi:hypothetical protein